MEGCSFLPIFEDEDEKAQPRDEVQEATDQCFQKPTRARARGRYGAMSSRPEGTMGRCRLVRCAPLSACALC